MRIMSERATHAILVVDDCPGLGATLAALFTCEGFRVHSASNGLEALDVLDREDVELVLSDVNMPDCDGFELLTRIKTRRAEGPVVLLHTGNTRLDLERGFLLGAEAIYFKPVEADTLVSAIHSYLPPQGRARRRFARHAVNLGIELLGDDCTAAASRCTTLARDGMFVECSNPPTVETPVAFKLDAGGPSPTMHGTGIVAWAGRGGYGIEFTRQSAGLAEGIAKIISQQPSFADQSA
jgi:two-component system chemotaxis response regulator CheY